MRGVRRSRSGAPRTVHGARQAASAVSGRSSRGYPPALVVFCLQRITGRPTVLATQPAGVELADRKREEYGCEQQRACDGIRVEHATAEWLEILDRREHLSEARGDAPSSRLQALSSC